MADRYPRVALGTVQFGLPYGVSNSSGRVRFEDAQAILSAAREAGFDTIDTAISYGASETVLGSLGVRGWHVISKLPPVPRSEVDVKSWALHHAFGSLARLRLEHLYALLLHHPADLLGPDGEALYSALVELKQRGLVRSIGVSIYDPSELQLLTEKFRFDVIQAPFNVLDRRLVSTGWLTSLSGAGIEIHVRSVFLQGLLLMSDASRPPYFARWQWLWNRWQQWLEANALVATEACLGFVLAREEISRVVVGLENAEQLAQVLAAVRRADLPDPPDELSVSDPALIDPRRWQTR